MRLVTGRRLRRHRADQARRLRRLRLARLLGAVLLLPGVPDRVPRGRPPSLHDPAVLPPVAAVLAVEHRQGSVDAVHARHRRLRRGARLHLPTARLPRARHRARRHRRRPAARHAARVRRLLRRLRCCAADRGGSPSSACWGGSPASPCSSALGVRDRSPRRPSFFNVDNIDRGIASTRCSTARSTSRPTAASEFDIAPPVVAGGVPVRGAVGAVPPVPVGGGQRPGARRGGRGRRADGAVRHLAAAPRAGPVVRGAHARTWRSHSPTRRCSCSPSRRSATSACSPASAPRCCPSCWCCSPSRRGPWSPRSRARSREMVTKTPKRLQSEQLAAERAVP